MSDYPRLKQRIKAPTLEPHSIEQLRLRVIPSQLAIKNSKEHQAIHRMSMLREMYRFNAANAEMLLIKNSRITEILYGDDSEYSIAFAREISATAPEKENPFLPMAIATLYNDSPSSYRSAVSFANALLRLSYLPVRNLRAFFFSPSLKLADLKKIGITSESAVQLKNKISELGLDANAEHCVPLKVCRHFFLQAILN